MNCPLECILFLAVYFSEYITVLPIRVNSETSSLLGLWQNYKNLNLKVVHTCLLILWNMSLNPISGTGSRPGISGPRYHSWESKYSGLDRLGAISTLMGGFLTAHTRNSNRWKNIYETNIFWFERHSESDGGVQAMRYEYMESDAFGSVLRA